MSRINSNISSLQAIHRLNRNNADLATRLQRLSSGLKINAGKDAPAKLIASETLRSEIAGINQAIDNSQRASNVIATAEGALGEVAALLLNIKDLVVEAANSGALSREEIEANQLQVDSAVESITRISNTTTFAGLKLLNGSLDYITSGVNTAEIDALSISQANFGTNDTIPVQINVVTSAKTAELQFTASAITGGSVTLEITGNEGVDVLTFTSGTTASAVAFAVNRVADSTGVTAELLDPLDATAGMTFKSTGYGSRQFVSVTAQSGTF